MKQVAVTIHATIGVPDDQNLDELAASIRQRGLGPEDRVVVDSVLVTDGIENGDG